MLGGAAIAAAHYAGNQSFALAMSQREAGIFTPEMFGATGDGVSNDSLAFERLGDAVSRAGGGTVEFGRGKTYIVGAQTMARRRGQQYAYAPAKLLLLSRCRKPVLLRGNGARLRCAPGLRFGTFDPSTGRPTNHKMPYFQTEERASPYEFMIHFESCSAPIEVADLELDGNLPNLLIGGGYGDTGTQIRAIGLAFFNNSGPEIVRNVYTHHHGLDGFYIDGAPGGNGAMPERKIVNLRSEYNGRQGCSIVGGRGYVFERCKFNHTGKSTLASAPGSGVDIEAEGGKTVRDISFWDCEFVNNWGPGLVADSGPSQGARFERCAFTGTTSWSAWPNKPYFAFHDCRFVGALAQAHGSADPSRATQFHSCTFTDDPRLSPTGTVYGGTNASRPLADLSDAKNVLFSKCVFLATHGGTLPWSTGAIYVDCRMKQTKKEGGYPRGIFRGRNVIDGTVDLYGSKVPGEIILNGIRHANRSF